jgi:hypothetical protein
VTTGRHISRRTVLRGLGAAIALPWLEAMAPRASAAAPAAKPPLRTVFLYHPLGAETTAWKGVTGAGKDMRLTPTLEPLEPVKEELLVLDGLNGRPHPASGHNRSACLWLSGAPAGKLDSWGAETDATIDQVLALQVGRGAGQPSLELSCTTVGNLMHAMNVSWRAPGVPTGGETNPRDVFARMFGDPKDDARRKSVLDVVADDAKELKQTLGPGDRRRLDEYLESVRSLERQIARFETDATARPAAPKITLLTVLPLQTDFTRVITCALGDESEGAEGTTYNRRLVDLGLDKSALSAPVDAKYLGWGHHQCSHDPKPTLPIIQAVDRWYVGQLSYFLQKLKALPDGDGTLLDSSIVVYGSTNAGGGKVGGWPGHGLTDVACLLAGKGGGLLPKPGRVVEFYGNDKKRNAGVPLSNLWLTLAQLAGVERKEFGRSTGTLAGLG